MERCSSNQRIPLNERPLEVVDHILSFTDVLKHDTQKEVKAAAHKLARLSLVCRAFDGLLVPRLNNLKRTHELITKYNRYNKQYNPGRHGGPPQLLCAINRLNRSNKEAEKAEIEKDIVDIVRLMPQSLTCTQGNTVHMWEVRPFTVAIFDLRTPDTVIELLAKSGANFNEAHRVTGRKYVSLMTAFANRIKNMPSELRTNQHLLNTTQRQEWESEIESAKQRYQLMQRLQNTDSQSQKPSNSTGAPIRKTAQQ